MYSFGAGYNRLGHGDGGQQSLPKLIAALQGKRESHSLVLLEWGEVRSFGCGKNGRLGHGDHDNQLLPKLIAPTSGVRWRWQLVRVVAGMHGDRRGWQEWSLESAKDETVFIVTGGGKRLEERGGRAAVTDDRVDRQRWRLEPAKDGKFFILKINLLANM